MNQPTLLRTAGKWVVRLAAGLGFLLILISVTPVLRWWTSALSAPWGPNDGDTLIVLGADLTSPGIPGASSYWRSVYAVLFWREGHYRRIIVTGKDVAESMRDFIAAQGVPRGSILVETAATSTRENALFTGRILNAHPGRNTLLTSDYHSLRALRAFRKAGIQVTALPFPDALKRYNALRNRWDLLWVLAEESVKTVYYRAQGWT